MALGDVVQTKTTAANTDSIAVTLTSAPTTGNVLVAQVFRSGSTGGNFTGPSELAFAVRGFSGTNRPTELWWGVVGAAPPSTYTFGLGAVADAALVVVEYDTQAHTVALGATQALTGTLAGGSVSSLTFGPQDLVESKGILFAGLVARADLAGLGWNNSFVQRDAVNTTAAWAWAASRYVTAAGAYQTTASWDTEQFSVEGLYLLLEMTAAASAAGTVSYYQRQTFGIKNFRQHGPR